MVACTSPGASANTEPKAQRVHVIRYVPRAQRGSLRPKYIPYSYMDAWEAKQLVLEGSWVVIRGAFNVA